MVSKKFKCLSILALSSLAILGIFFGVSLIEGIALAAHNEGSNGGLATGGACAVYAPRVGYSTWFDGCVGASWSYYSIDDLGSRYSGDSITTAAASGVGQYVISGCAHAGGFYRLGYQNYNLGSDGRPKPLSSRFEGRGNDGWWRQAGLVQVRNINYSGDSAANGSVEFAYASGYWFLKDWNTVKQAYQNSIRENGLPDNWANISWFCSSPDGGSSTPTRDSGTFSSTSTVYIGGEPSQTRTSSVNGTAQLTYYLAGDKDTVSFGFTHSIRYEKPDAPGATFDGDTSTYWSTSTNPYLYTPLDTSGWISTGYSGYNGAKMPNYGYTYTVDAPAQGGSKTYCETISYLNQQEFEVSGNTYRVNGNNSERSSSTACVTIIRGTVTQETSTSNAYPGHFWGRSRVYTNSSGDVMSVDSDWITTKNTSSNEIKKTIKLSTDQDRVTVQFEHELGHDDKLWYWRNQKPPEDSDPIHALASNDKFPANSTMYSTYKIEQTVTGRSSQTIQASTNFTVQNSPSSGGDRVAGVYNSGQTVSMGEGETVTICQTLTHDNHDVSMSRKHEDTKTQVPKADGSGFDTRIDHKPYEYTASRSSTNYKTTVCAEITRPILTVTTDKFGTGPGITNAPILYAGEPATFTWDIRAQYYPTRRLIGYQRIAYLLRNDAPQESRYYQGNLQTNNSSGLNRRDIAPCSHFPTTYRTYCWVQDEGDTNLSASTSGRQDYTNSTSYTSPDNVGYKLCHGFGLHYQYYAHNGDNWSLGQTYWTIYNSSCRTIAKKPSAAFVNGGISANNVSAIIAYRNLSNDIGSGLRPGISDSYATKFGSWTEYLANIRGNDAGIASGSAWARGSTNDLMSSSKMTISNTNTSNLGHSDLSRSSTTTDRLQEYLGTERGNGVSLEDTSEIRGTTIPSGQTQIYRSSSGMTISGNIEVADANYTDIYKIPQAIIYVNGDVNITSNVTRIDAWIIATGNINTCQNFVASSTQTNPASYRPCDNKLQINGPVVAGSLTLNRTYGADPILQEGREAPAETFNLPATSYVWAYAQATRYNSSYTEVYSRELPPRY